MLKSFLSCHHARFQGLTKGTTRGTTLRWFAERVNQNAKALLPTGGPLIDLNGQTDTFWQIVNDNPNDLPVQIANKLQAATGRNLSGPSQFSR